MVKKGKKMKLLFPIHRNNFHTELFLRFEEIYSKFTDVIPIIMDKNPEDIVKSLPPGLQDPVVIDAEFNYSKAINYTLKTLDGDDIVIISDPKSITSVWQINEELADINFEQEYIYVKTMQNIPDFGSEINFKSQRFMVSIITRILRMKEAEESFPTIVTTPNIILKYINGLEESYKTPASTINLKRKLQQFGLQEHQSGKLALNIGSYIDDLDKEMNLSRNIKDEEFIFIPNNYKRGIGDIENNDELDPESSIIKEPEPLNKEKVIPSQTQKNTRPSVRYRPSHTTKSLKKIIPENSSSSPREKIAHVLVAVQTTTKHIVAATPLIKSLNKENYYVDILTNDKMSVINNIIPSDLIKNKFDTGDISTKYIPFKRYSRVIRTVDCNINIPVNIPVLNCNSTSAELDISLRNIQCMNEISHEGKIESILPACAFSIPTKKVPDNSITICISNNKKSEFEWKSLVSTIEHLAAQFKDRMIILYSLHGERKLINTNIFKTTHNVVDIDRVGLLDTAGFIKYSQVSIVSTDSDSFWLSYAVKAQTIAYGIETPELPSVPWIRTLHCNGVIDEKEVENTICELM